MKKQITEYYRISLYDLEGTFDGIEAFITQKRLEGWKGIEVSTYPGEIDINLFKVRDETDEEYNNRLKIELKNKEVTIANKRKLYEELKKEFERDDALNKLAKNEEELGLDW